jgi:methyl-accepting chemotaxis protein
MTVRMRFILVFLTGMLVVVLSALIFRLLGIIMIDLNSSPFLLSAGFVLTMLVLACALVTVERGAKRFEVFVGETVERIENIAAGRPSPALPEEAPETFVLIDDAISTVGNQLGMVMQQLGSLSERVLELTASADHSFDQVKTGGEAQGDLIEQASLSLEILGDDFRNISELTDSYASRIAQSAVNASKIDKGLGQATRSAGNLQGRIEQVSKANKEGDLNTRAMAQAVVDLTAHIQLTQGAIGEMIDQASRTKGDAGQAAGVMGKLESETEQIGRALEDLIQGSDEARRSNGRILAVTGTLASRIDLMDDVIAVIHNLAERTKLLSINASIIASEAGEHGRAFAVVAREVKDLAQSTTGAISEISQVVKSLKDGFSDTVQTIEQGQDDVEQGVALARRAVNLLSAVPEDVRQAASWNKGIAAKTTNQVAKAAQIETVMSQATQTLDQISGNLNAQISVNDKNVALFHELSSMADQLLNSSRDHNDASVEVRQTTDSLSVEFRELAERARKHILNLGKVLAMAREALSITDANQQRTDELSRLFNELNRYAFYLGEDFRKNDGK